MAKIENWLRTRRRPIISGRVATLVVTVVVRARNLQLSQVPRPVTKISLIKLQSRQVGQPPVDHIPFK